MQAKLRGWGLVLGLLIWVSGGAWAGTIFVKASATGANSGGSWADAHTDLQAALAAAQAGDEIWVAAGTYKPTSSTDRTISFVMTTGMGLYGGFAGTETTRKARDWRTHETILNGNLGTEGSIPVKSDFIVTGANQACLDGFTVSGGGCAMINNAVSATVANCAFTNNAGI